MQDKSLLRLLKFMVRREKELEREIIRRKVKQGMLTQSPSSMLEDEGTSDLLENCVVDKEARS